MEATPGAAEFVAQESQPEEPRWRTLDRLVAELVRLRAVAAGSAAEIRQRELSWQGRVGGGPNK
jgi:hypothetical protein